MPIANAPKRLMSLFYHQPGMVCPSSPPRIPIPKRAMLDTSRCGSFRSDTESVPSLPVYMGDTFPYLCRFWTIVREVSWVYHAKGKLPWGYTWLSRSLRNSNSGNFWPGVIPYLPNCPRTNIVNITMCKLCSELSHNERTCQHCAESINIASGFMQRSSTYSAHSSTTPHTETGA